MPLSIFAVTEQQTQQGHSTGGVREVDFTQRLGLRVAVVDMRGEKRKSTCLDCFRYENVLTRGPIWPN